jgi:hypothetical protein
MTDSDPHFAGVEPPQIQHSSPVPHGHLGTHCAALFEPSGETLISCDPPQDPAGMVSEPLEPLQLPQSIAPTSRDREMSEQPYLVAHETPADDFNGEASAPASCAEHSADALSGYSESEISSALRRERQVLDVQELIARGDTLVAACRRLEIPPASYCRWRDKFAAEGTAGLIDRYSRCGPKPDLELTDDEKVALQKLYLPTNRTETAGSMRTAAKFFALNPATREIVREKILAALDAGRVPGAVRRVLERITPAHVEGHRRPKLNQKQHFSSKAGAFLRDKLQRRRVIESDDGTLNFVCWIPWPIGGDPCSDKYGVRCGRWQFLPMIEAGWSHFYLGYNLVCRPRGSYREEDIRSLIDFSGRSHGLPDAFRFERGSWEANRIVELLGQLGVELITVHQPNHKPFVEGGFNTLWTYLSVIDGQVGRYRGDEEQSNLVLQKCRAGRADPREHFPSLDQAIKAIDGAMAVRNSDKITSVYGSWIPEQRFTDHKTQRPWPQIPEALRFLFAPYVREWTVAGGRVSGKIQVVEDCPVTFEFWSEELWRWNGHKVKLYFDPAADPCIATLVSLETYHGFRPGELICAAPLTGEISHHARACVGWADESSARELAERRISMAALRRELRALDPGGHVRAASSEMRDGQGNRVEVRSAKSEVRSDSTSHLAPRTSLLSPRTSRLLATPEEFSRQSDRLARQAELAERLKELTQ